MPRADDATAPVCFRLAEAAPIAAPPGPLRLRPVPAEALAELLQVFACGEESASLAFARLGRSPLEATACRALAGIAGEEREHERLLRGLRGALPAPPRDRTVNGRERNTPLRSRTADPTSARNALGLSFSSPRNL